jgi:hypothetical protein
MQIMIAKNHFMPNMGAMTIAIICSMIVEMTQIEIVKTEIAARKFVAPSKKAILKGIEPNTAKRYLDNLPLRCNLRNMYITT